MEEREVEEMKQFAVILICIAMVLSSFIMVIDLGENVEAKEIVGDGVNYTPHAPITILSDADFSSIATSGDGSAGNPWIIEN